MDRLSAEDRLMLWPDAVWPQDVGVLAILEGADLLEPDGRLRLRAARDAVERRLHLLPRFRQVLHTPKRGLGWPLWVDDPHFDLAHHVDVAQVPPPGDEAALLHTVERLRSRRLDRSRPLWELWFLPGLPDARVGLFIRLHHVISDGMAGVANLRALLSETPARIGALPVPWTPSPRPSTGELLADNLRARADRARRSMATLRDPAGSVDRARAAWPALRELVAEKPGPRTSLNRVVGPDRTFALLRSDLDGVHRVARSKGATINDVLLAATAAGTGALLQSRGEPVVNQDLPIYVPVSLRRGRSAEARGNLISQMVIRLPVGPQEPADRLRVIASRTAVAKERARSSLGATFRGRILRAALLRLVIRQRVNLGSADLPGPQETLYFSSARLLEVFPLINLIGNVSLAVGAMSYAGQFDVMVVADGDAYPDLDVFAEAARSELRALAESDRQSPDSRS